MSAWLFLPQMDWGTFQTAWNDTTLNKPWRCVSLAAFGHPEAPWFAAIWHYEEGRPYQEPLLNVSQDEVEDAIVQKHAETGMLPVLVTASYGDAGPAQWNEVQHVTDIRYHFIFEETQLPLSSLRFLRRGTVDELLGMAWAGPSANLVDYDLASFDAIGNANDANASELRFTGLLYPKTLTSVATGVNYSTITSSPFTLQEWEKIPLHQSLRRAWARPDQVVPSPYGPGADRLVLSSWRDDVYRPWPANMADPTYDGGAVVIGPRPFSTLSSSLSQFAIESGQDWVPRHIAVSGYGAIEENDPMFCMVLTARTHPLPRKFVVVDARDPSPPLQVEGKLHAAAKKRFFNMLPRQSARSRFEAWEEAGMGRRVGWRDAAGRIASLDHRLRGPSDAEIAMPSAPGPLIERARPSDLLGGFKTIIPTSGGGGGNGGGSLLMPTSVLDAGAALLTAKRYLELDAWVHERLETYGARSAQLVIAVGGRLVVCRGYVLAELGYPTNRPLHHLMPIASVCKPLTGMAAVREFFPSGDLLGIHQRLDQALGVQSMSNQTLRQRMRHTTLASLLKHEAGWPGGFDNLELAALGHAGGLPLVPGDTLGFVMKTAQTFLEAETSYPYLYSSPAVVALSERLSQLLAGGTGDVNPLQIGQFVTRIRDNFWGLPETEVPTARHTPAEREVFKMFPNHSSWIGPGNYEGFPMQFDGFYEYDAGVGGFWMKAATLARILSGMDASAINVPQLLHPAAVQRLIDGTTPALFASEKVIEFTSLQDLTVHRLLHHNGGGPGVSAIGGIYLPNLPYSTPPSMCIVYLENWDNPLEPGWGRAMLDELRAIARKIESDHGWESDDLFTFL